MIPPDRLGIEPRTEEWMAARAFLDHAIETGIISMAGLELFLEEARRCRWR